MQHPNKAILEQAVAIIDAAKTEVVELLNPDLGTIAIGVKSRMDQLTGFLTGIGGLTVGVNHQNNAFPTLAEAAEAAGIPMRKALEPDSITVTNEELDRFRTRVEAMGTAIHEMTNDQILATLNTPEGEKVIRGIAKKAGFADYREVPIDILLIERLQEAGRTAADVQAQQDALRAEESQINHTVTEKTLADNPVMNDQGIKVGDDISFNAGGTPEEPVTPPVEATETAKPASKKK